MTLVAQKQPLLVAAASDLAPLEKPLRDLYKKTYNRELRLVLGSSGMLATQIRNSAPYDVFLSANLQFVRDLEASSYVLPGSVRVYAAGRLAIWSKSLSIKTMDLLADPRITHIAIANPKHAPYGLAAHQAMERARIWEQVKGKVVLAENVRQCLQYAESGNAQVALLAWSLVFSRGGVLLPESLHDPILQAGGVVAGSSRRAAAADLLDLLVSPHGRALLSRYGFFPMQK
ncbi:MAG: molybdate ABC transporter substrate-binding protein [Acidobacteriia bacterium]|nr:molybdate ABC transporter substrate-binding protein [Terriglobia bacterium]